MSNFKEGDIVLITYISKYKDTRQSLMSGKVGKIERVYPDFFNSPLLVVKNILPYRVSLVDNPGIRAMYRHEDLRKLNGYGTPLWKLLNE